MTGTIRIEIESPEYDRDRNKIEYIGRTSGENITLNTSFGTLESFRLEETSRDLGYFLEQLPSQGT